MAEEETDVVLHGEENTSLLSGVDTEGTDAETGGRTAEDDDGYEFEIRDDDMDNDGKDDDGVDGKKEEEKKDDNLLVVDELDYDIVVESDEEETTEDTGGPVFDSEMSERGLLTMPSLKTVMGDLLHLRRNRRVSLYPLSLADISDTKIQAILDSDRCEEAKLQMIRPNMDMTTWHGFLILTFMSSKAASAAVEELKSFKDGLTVKLDGNPEQTLETFLKGERKASAWPTYWSSKLVLVRGLSAETKPDDVRHLFPDADEIVVAKDSAPAVRMPGAKFRGSAAKSKSSDGYAYVLYETEDAANAAAGKYSTETPIFKENYLDVKKYREPVSEIPRSLLWLRRRRFVLRHLDKLTAVLENSQADSTVKVPANIEQMIAKCKDIIAKDNEQRKMFGLPTPSLDDFKEIRGLQPLKSMACNRILVALGIVERKKQPPGSGGKSSGTRRSRGQKSGGRGGDRRGNRDRSFPRGRGRFGRDARDFRRSPPRYHGDRFGDRNRFMGGVGGGMMGAPNDPLGVISQLAMIMQQPSLSMLGPNSGMMNPVMSARNLGSGMPVGAGGRGYDAEPLPKMMRMDDPGRNMRGDRDMRVYDDRPRIGDRPMQRPRSPDYRAPPQRSQHGGLGRGGGNVGFGGPRNYGGDAGGAGSSTEDNLNLLVNLSKMISNKMDQRRQ